MKRYLMLFMCIAGACAPQRKPNADNGVVPDRIVALSPAITQKLYLLGVGDKIIANTVYCPAPEGEAKKEKIGNAVQVDIEHIVSLAPDLVIASKLTRPEQVEKLRSVGIRVVRRSYPESFEELCTNFLELGDMVGRREQAVRIVEEVYSEVERLKSLTAGQEKRSVFIQLGAKPLFAATKDSFVNDYIEFAGGSNIVPAGASGIYSREKVVVQNPDVIIVTTMGIVGDAERKDWMNFKTIKAVANDEVYVLDSYRICSPTPAMFVEGLKDVIRTLHPEVELE